MNLATFMTAARAQALGEVLRFHQSYGTDWGVIADLEDQGLIKRCGTTRMWDITDAGLAALKAISWSLPS